MEQYIEYKGIYMKIKITKNKIILETNDHYHYKQAYNRTGKDTDLLKALNDFAIMADIR